MGRPNRNGSDGDEPDERATDPAVGEPGTGPDASGPEDGPGPGSDPEFEADGDPGRSGDRRDGGTDEGDGSYNDGGAADEEGPISRRTLIRVLVGLGIGIPVVIELRTLLHLVESWLGGDEDGEPGNGSDAGAGTETGTDAGAETTPDGTDADEGTGGDRTTPAGRRVAVGEELLPETPQAETVTEATLQTGRNGRRFVVRVEVVNDTTVAHELRLGRLVTTGGRVVDGGGGGRVEPDETAIVTAEWTLPEGARPDRVFVIAVTGTETTRTVSRQVAIEPETGSDSTDAAGQRP